MKLIIIGKITIYTLYESYFKCIRYTATKKYRFKWTICLVYVLLAIEVSSRHFNVCLNAITVLCIIVIMFIW